LIAKPVQPGLARLETPSGARSGGWLVYPNSAKLPVGAPFDFWDYDADWGGWWVYGQGKVGANGTQVFPNPGVRFYEFTGAMVGTATAPPKKGNCQTSAGPDPVDCSTGLFFHTEADLYLRT
jgi:hypothetical protein